LQQAKQDYPHNLQQNTVQYSQQAAIALEGYRINDGYSLAPSYGTERVNFGCDGLADSRNNGRPGSNTRYVKQDPIPNSNAGGHLEDGHQARQILRDRRIRGPPGAAPQQGTIPYAKEI